MWLFTKDGFYSVVQDKTDNYTLVLRSRDLEDLERFRTKYLDSGTVIHKTWERDYPYRIFLPRSLFSQIVPFLVEEITYTNFKDEVRKRIGKYREGIYHQVWYTLMSIEKVARHTSGIVQAMHYVKPSFMNSKKKGKRNV